MIRGTATGANNFFFLTTQQVEELAIPQEFLKLAIGRTKDVTGDKLTIEDIKKLQENNRPTILLSINSDQNIPESVANYLKEGEKLGLPNRPLIKQRKFWYKMEFREVPPILFAVLLWVDRDTNASINVKRVGLGLFPTIKRRKGNPVVSNSTTNSTSKEVLATLRMYQKPTPTCTQAV